MDARVLIETLQSRGLNVSLARDKVRVEAPQEPDEDTKGLLQQLSEHKEEVKSFLNKEDPILAPEQWIPHFRDLHHKVIKETPDFDYGWLQANRPDVYRAIKAREQELDSLRGVRLSQVMGIMREWRELVLKADSERKKSNLEARPDRNQ